MKKHSFKRKERIVQRGRFKIIYNQGVWRSSKHFVTVMCANEEGTRRLGITTTRKVGNAVRRNRVRRLIREFFRLHKDLFPDNVDIVIIAKRGMPFLTYWQVCDELTELFTRKSCPC